MKKDIEQLLESPYWIIDILPERVKEDSKGQYFNIADHYRDRKYFKDIKMKHINLILKLNCYRDISIYGEDIINPPVDQIIRKMLEEYTYIMIDDSMIQSETDETYMTVYNPDDDLIELIRQLGLSEGLFVWKK